MGKEREEVGLPFFLWPGRGGGGGWFSGVLELVVVGVERVEVAVPAMPDSVVTD